MTKFYNNLRVTKISSIMEYPSRTFPIILVKMIDPSAAMYSAVRAFNNLAEAFNIR